MIIRSSKSEPRVVPIILFNHLLTEYIETLPSNPEVYLFHRKNNVYEPLSHDTITSWFLKLSKRLRRRIHPHMLRHSRATELVKMGLSEKEVMYVLGERTRDMIDIYVTLTAKDVKIKLASTYGIKEYWHRPMTY